MTPGHEQSTVFDVQEVPIDFPDDSEIGHALAAWTQWCAGAKIPQWQNVELFNLSTELLRNTILVDVLDGGADYRYRYWGAGFAENFGLEATGMLLSDALGESFVKATHIQMDKVLAAKAPVAFVSVMKAKDSGLSQRNTILRLPISEGDVDVAKVLTVTTFGILSHQEAEAFRVALEADRIRQETGQS